MTTVVADSLPAELASLEHLSEALLQKYNTSGPRYTSYPTAPMWQEEFKSPEMTTALNDIGSSTAPLSLYTHLPFCEARCLFCSCNVVITRNREQVDVYMAALFKDMARVANDLGDGAKQRPVKQFHWGGGTPTYLTSAQMATVFNEYKRHFTFADDAEIAIEVDPRVTTAEQMTTLRDLGFNRVSLGVQDFYGPTQEAVRRVQSLEQTEALVTQARDLGFGGINFDLIYGLPHQTETSFADTLETVIRLSPDRIALYNFAYVPWMSPHQQALDEATLPDGPVKFAIFKHAIGRLLGAGYVYIGMDHFAKPTDELSIAWREGSLHRNFMGYTTQAGCELLGLGVSAISGLNNHYAQNARTLADYYKSIDAGQHPTLRGLTLNSDDHLRRGAIHQVLCNAQLRWDTLDADFGINSRKLFAEARNQHAAMAADGLITLDGPNGDDGFTLTLLGRILSRNIAMPFDAYLKNNAANVSPRKPDAPRREPIYSKTL